MDVDGQMAAETMQIIQLGGSSEIPNWSAIPLVLSSEIDLNKLKNVAMANEKLILARTNTEALISNLRGEVGEVVTSWLLMRHYIAAGRSLKTGDLHKDLADKNQRFVNLMADKISDEVVGRLSELAESKIGQLTFYFATRKLHLFASEAKLFSSYIVTNKIRDKRNRDISHKQMPGEKGIHSYLHVEYRVLVKAIVLALRLMKKIDRHFLGPSSKFLWKEARKRRYEFLSPPRAGYMLVPYLNLSPEERVSVVVEELAEGRTKLTEIQTLIDGQAATLLACKPWGVVFLEDQILPLPTYPLIEIQNISTAPSGSDMTPSRL